MAEGDLEAGEDSEPSEDQGSIHHSGVNFHVYLIISILGSVEEATTHPIEPLIPFK